MSDLVYVCSLLGFIAKFPVFPLHIWLPKAHVESPLEGSIVLAGVLLKIACLGAICVRRLVRATPIIFSLLCSVCLVGGVICCVSSIRQRDIKSIIAYSSVSHISLVFASLTRETSTGVQGSVVIRVRHGITSVLMFGIASGAYDISFSRRLVVRMGAIKNSYGIRAILFSVCLRCLSVPPFISFLRELIIIFSVVSCSWYYRLLCGVNLRLSVLYVFNWFTSLCNFNRFIRPIRLIVLSKLILVRGVPSLFIVVLSFALELVLFG